MSATALDRSRTTPLWEQLLADLRRRLDHDEFAVAFPSELALVAQYGVSRHTVREAVRRLREEGLVIAGRGRTPRRAEPSPIEQPLGEIYSLFTAVEATGRVQRSVVRTLDVRADGVVAARLGLEESTPLVHLERLRLVDFGRTALYTEYAARCGVRVTGGNEVIRAVVPDAAQRGLLGIGPGVAALAIDRLGCAGDVPVEWRQTLVRADRFSVTARFSATDGYQVGGS
jgi:GntR family transcriptional regulator